MRRFALSLVILTFAVVVSMGEGLTCFARAAGVSGTLESGEILRVGPGERLVVDGRLRVSGVLELAGEEGRPAVVEITGRAPYGIEVNGGKVLGRWFEVRSDGGGVSAVSGMVKLRCGKVEAERVGLNAGGDSVVTLEGVSFVGGKAGVVVRGNSKVRVDSCVFSGLKKGGIYAQEEADLEVVNSSFKGNTVGVVVSMTDVGCRVVNSLFERNGTGMFVDKMASPSVVGNRFVGNRVAVKFTRRGRGMFEENVFDENGISVHLEYSSYPKFRRNDFLSFGRFAVYVENQSYLWERDAGLEDREFFKEKGAFGFGVEGRASASLPDEVLTGKLDFRGNYWGKLTGEIEAGKSNLSGIRDGMDKPYFSYRGKRYPLDVVDFSEFSRTSFTERRQGD